ncbi:MAG TPA: endolytic transglycosylase MltG [Candidatus Acidoferrales bacterium]|nr:endolytic transglycosylase MltG [Candidatus Acidoferrales bacterium]
MRKAIVLTVLMLLLAAGGTAVWFQMVLHEPYMNFSSEGIFVTVPHGASGRSVARLMEKNGVIRSALVFRFLVRQHPRRPLQAGEYFFDHPQTPGEVFEGIASGRIFEKIVTVPEGYTMFDIAQLFEQQGFMKREEFLAAAGDPSMIRDLAPDARNLEGFLFPATYHFPRHPTPQDAVSAMVHHFREVWQRLDPGVPSGDHTVEQIVTLASLVERETPLPAERPMVAAVFSNRLRTRHSLQCDPTVVYALSLAGKYRGSLTRADLRFDSPYNTYRYRGLPPGPIANPGEESLRAALEPAPVNYFYFVANTKGGHFFSQTLAEHNRNVARYHRMLAQAAQGQGSGNTAREEGEEPPKKRTHRKHSS